MLQVRVIKVKTIYFDDIGFVSHPNIHVNVYVRMYYNNNKNR